MLKRTISLFLLLAFAALAQPRKYDGPIPPKPDIPYLKHAGDLLPTDVGEAKEEKKKDTVLYIIDGAAASAKTPLTSPIFLMQSNKLVADKLALYKLDVRNGRRELLTSPKKPARPIRLDVSRVSGNLYKIEVEESLPNGEYSLSPEGSNQVFCFQVY